MFFNRPMFFNKPWDEWIARYETSHRNSVNRICHTIGIPLIVVSILMAAAGLFIAGLWPWALGLFIAGWALQFVGHIFEGKKPEFFSDWRFLFVGLRWWIAKVTGRV